MYFVTGHTIPSFPTPNLNFGPAQAGTTTASVTPVVIQLTNGHTWVNQSGKSVTAFAVQASGGSVILQSISLKGLPAPSAQWYSCNPVSCDTSTNINTQLTANYNPAAGVSLGDGNTYPTTVGPNSLDSGQATIVYVTGAGNIAPIDSGNTYPLQVVAGQSSASLQVQVATK